MDLSEFLPAAKSAAPAPAAAAPACGWVSVAAGSSAVVVGAVRVAVAGVVADVVAPLGGLPRFLCGFIIVLRFGRGRVACAQRWGGEGCIHGQGRGERGVYRVRGTWVVC